MYTSIDDLMQGVIPCPLPRMTAHIKQEGVDGDRGIKGSVNKNGRVPRQQWGGSVSPKMSFYKNLQRQSYLVCQRGPQMGTMVRQRQEKGGTDSKVGVSSSNNMTFEIKK